ncbi:MAG: hypothetical protein WC496_08095 [Phycisphaerae bacterium]|jgi:hypothetical protein
MGNEINWFENFKKPPIDFRPVVFWSWNEAMQPDEVRRQVRLLARGGMGGGFIHSRIGLLTEYLGDKWFTAVDAALDEAQKCGILMYLYDEDKWPSGFAGGKVPLADKNFRMKTLLARPASDNAPADCEPIGPVFGDLMVYKYTSPLGHSWFNGTCYVDTMSQEAMKCFIENGYKPYFDRYSKFYGNLIPAEFTDEPCVCFRGRLPAGSVPFTDAVIETFKDMNGYDPLSRLDLLFRDEPGAAEFRLDYFRTINHLFEQNFSKQIGDWCRSHNLAWTGHYMCEHDLLHQQLWGVKIMPNYRHQDYPGIDHLGRQIDERIAAKQCQSAVNQFGKKRMLSELFGCSGQNVSFEDRFWIAAQQICLGVNFLNPHLSLYTMAGCRKRDYPPNIFYQQPWWPANIAIDEPLSRLCFAMSRGKYVPEFLLLHPQESTFVLSQARTDRPAQIDHNVPWDFEPLIEKNTNEIKNIDSNFKQVVDSLLTSQRTFDIGDETIIAENALIDPQTASPAIVIGRMRYQCIIIPNMTTIAKSTFDLLRKFHAKGGKIVRYSKTTKLLDGKYSSELEAWLQNIPEISKPDLCRQCPPLVKVISEKDTSLLWVHLRDLEDGTRLAYLANLNRLAAIDCRIELAGNWQSARLLDFWTGDCKPVTGHTDKDAFIIDAHFEPAEVLLLNLSPLPQSLKSNIEPVVTRQIQLDSINWQVTRLDDNSMPLDCALYRTEADWSQTPLPLTAIQKLMNETRYTGPLTLKYTFNADKEKLTGRKLHLIIEHPEYCSICINDIEAVYNGLPYWKDPRWLPIDIAKQICRGKNEIKLHYNNFRFGDLSSTEDMWARYGTEIEPIYIIGDFSIEARIDINAAVSQDPFKTNIHKLTAGSAMLTAPKSIETGDFTLQGLPFYSGRISLKGMLDNINFPENARVFLRINTFNAPVIEIKLDGIHAGYIIGRQSKILITQEMQNAREIELILYGSLCNLLGPHHHPQGEPIWVTPEHFVPHFNEPDFRKAVEQWLSGDLQPLDWQNDYYLLKFGNLNGLRFEIET